MNSKGVLFPDKEDNVHTIALKTARSDGSVVAKFARSLWTNGTGDSDLSGCTVKAMKYVLYYQINTYLQTFYFPIEGVSTLKKEERTENNTLITFEFETLKTMNVCGIANECRIDLPNKLDHSIMIIIIKIAIQNKKGDIENRGRLGRKYRKEVTGKFSPT